MNDIILKLEQLGFSPYEAKAYYALLRKQPANGYEVSKIARIPTAKVYETLNRLKNKGLVVETEGGAVLSAAAGAADGAAEAGVRGGDGGAGGAAE